MVCLVRTVLQQTGASLCFVKLPAAFAHGGNTIDEDRSGDGASAEYAPAEKLQRGLAKKRNVYMKGSQGRRDVLGNADVVDAENRNLLRDLDIGFVQRLQYAPPISNLNSNSVPFSKSNSPCSSEGITSPT